MKILSKSLLDLIPLALVTIAISLLTSYSLLDTAKSYDEIISNDLIVLSDIKNASEAINEWNGTFDRIISLIVAKPMEAFTILQESEQSKNRLDTNLKKIRKYLVTLGANSENSEDRFLAEKSNEMKQIVDGLLGKLSEIDYDFQILDENINLRLEKNFSEMAYRKVRIEAEEIVTIAGFKLGDARGIALETKQIGSAAVIQEYDQLLKVYETFMVELGLATRALFFLKQKNAELSFKVNNMIGNDTFIAQSEGETKGKSEEEKFENLYEINKIIKALIFGGNVRAQIYDETWSGFINVKTAAERLANKEKMNQSRLDSTGASASITKEYFSLNTGKKLLAAAERLKQANETYFESTVKLLKGEVKLFNARTRIAQDLADGTQWLENLNNLMSEVLDAKSSDYEELTQNRIIQTWVMSAIGLALAIFIGIVVARRSIVIPMNELSNVASRIANTGNFSIRLKTTGNDEISMAGKSINDMLSKTEKAFVDLRELFSSVASGDLTARMPSNYQGDILKCANHIDNSLQKLSSALIDILEDVRQVASSAAQAGDAVGQVADGAQSQVKATSQVREKISALSESARSQVSDTKEIQRKMKQSEEIATSVDQSAKATSEAAENATKLAALGSNEAQETSNVVNEILSNSTKIGDISALIEDIAQQTTMLALNASIEASRAGEAGRGFSVVASEVGKLSDKSSSSVKSITELTTKAKENASTGVNRMESLQIEMKNIQETISNIEQMMTEITKQTSDQSNFLNTVLQAADNLEKVGETNATSSEEISRAINDLEKIGESNAVSSEEITASMLELSKIAENTKDKISNFKLQNDPTSSQKPESEE